MASASKNLGFAQRKFSYKEGDFPVRMRHLCISVRHLCNAYVFGAACKPAACYVLHSWSHQPDHRTMCQEHVFAASHLGTSYTGPTRVPRIALTLSCIPSMPIWHVGPDTHSQIHDNVSQYL